MIKVFLYPVFSIITYLLHLYFLLLLPSKTIELCQQLKVITKE